MHPLKLSTNPDGWHLYIQRKADPAFKSLRKKVLARDQYTCQFCGFQAKKYQEIINLDHDYNNNKLNNMVTACCFCSQCFFVEMVGKYGFGGGKLIYLPEMTQAELNAFSHVIFCAITNETSYKDTAQTIYRNLKFRSQPIEDKFGANTSSPSVFGEMLYEYKDKPDIVQKFLVNFRLLPALAIFKKQLEGWASAVASELKT